MAYNDYHINLGVDRETKAVERDERTYLRIDCYTANGRYKGNYQAGYIVTETGEYIVGRYDDINAETIEWIK